MTAGVDPWQPLPSAAWCGTLPDMRSKTPVGNFAPGRLRALRQQAGLTLTDLAERAQIPRPNLSHYESGARTAGFDAVVAMADALDIEPLELTDADPDALTLADLRLQARRSRVELAAAASVSYDTWYAIETGRRRLTDEVAARVAAVLDVTIDELRAAHTRTRSNDRQLRVGHPRTTARHFALRHHLGADVAAAPATEAWARARIAELARTAGLDTATLVVTTTPAAFRAVTGITVGPADHGMASWADTHVLYVDPAKAGTCGDLERLIAHELGHLRWPALGHRQRFFDRVQHLLDHAPTPISVDLVGALPDRFGEVRQRRDELARTIR